MDETEYAATLLAERHMYAWTLQRYGQLTALAAQEKANAFYAYTAADVPLRELVFHNQAWHWAMLALFGERYLVSAIGSNTLNLNPCLKPMRLSMNVTCKRA
ncbi:hypothetical protein [Shewanella sp.]|uniref:hypothetical protein n=1 Tax=Shewanella sp. TaxID=50422 RepID=UPI003A96DC57